MTSAHITLNLSNSVYQVPIKMPVHPQNPTQQLLTSSNLSKEDLVFLFIPICVAILDLTALALIPRHVQPQELNLHFDLRNHKTKFSLVAHFRVSGEGSTDLLLSSRFSVIWKSPAFETLLKII